MPACECGADIEACSRAWDKSLALEYTDPEYGAVHHLTVPAYMLQHGSRLTLDGWLEMRRRLRAFLEGGLTPEDARRMAPPTSSGSLTRGDTRGPSGLTWSRHLTEVNREDAARYREEVTGWATSTLREALAAEG